MKASEIVSQIRKELKNKVKLKSKEEREKAKVTLGDEAKVLGLKVPEARKIAEPFAEKLKKKKDFETAIKVADELYKSGVFEEATVAESILREFKRYFDDLTFTKFDDWIDYLKNWANIDMLCGWLIASMVMKDKSRIKDFLKWTKSGNRWRRRAAAIALVKPVRKGLYLKEAFRVAENLMEDKDEMVQKGVGWLLKEAGSTFPEETVKFLIRWRNKTSRLALRLACEKLPPENKRKVLG